MNESISARLFRVATTISRSYVSHPNVQSIALVGSVARSHADRFSDVDLMIFYNELPTKDELAFMSEKAHGTGSEVLGGDLNRAAESFQVGWVRCDLLHVTVSGFEDQLITVIENYDPDHLKQRELSLIADAQPLYGSQLIERWKVKMSNYPSELVRAVIDARLAFFSPKNLRNMDEQVDWLTAKEFLVEAEKRILQLLFAVNHMYDPVVYKWLDVLVGRMQIAPLNLSIRLKQVLREELSAAVPKFIELLRETLSLIALHVPEVNTEAVKRQLNHISFH